MTDDRTGQTSVSDLDDRSAAGTVFLERRSYSRRRLNDASKLLPVLGVVLFMVPLVWQSGPDAAPMSRVFAYIFVVWAMLIAVNALFWLGVSRWVDSWSPTGAPLSDKSGQE
ncbi:MAG: hypothetical protein ACU0AZ_10345 [Paracoccaceae bacterium]|jgi:uncharacterized membrane protein YfbV (UPF0208 family)